MITLRVVVLGAVLGIGAGACDQQEPERGACVVFLECYGFCRDEHALPDRYPDNYPGDGTDVGDDHDRCFESCGGWDLEYDPGTVWLRLMPLQNRGGGQWGWIARCLSGDER